MHGAQQTQNESLRLSAIPPPARLAGVTGQCGKSKDFRALLRIVAIAMASRNGTLRAQLVSTILPMCWLVSIRAWAAAASRSG